MAGPHLLVGMEESPAAYYGTVAGSVVGLTLLVASQAFHGAGMLLYPGGAALVISIFVQAYLIAQGGPVESGH